jgi:hypothetical protein
MLKAEEGFADFNAVLRYAKAIDPIEGSSSALSAYSVGRHFLARITPSAGGASANPRDSGLRPQDGP